MFGNLYFYDEYISMLAAQMVVEHGLPFLPSGFFYEHGLLLSYLDGLLLALTGFKEEMARWPVLLLSVFTVAAYYAAARRLFGSTLAGLLAATLVTLDELSILWGTRARMYSQAHLFGLLTVTWLLMGTLQRPAPRYRYLGLAFLAAMLFSHAVTFLILPPLGLLLLLFSWFYRRDWLRQPRLWQEAGVALLIVMAALATMAAGIFKPGGVEAVTQTTTALAAAPPAGFRFLGGFISPGLAWTRFDNLVGFFDEPPYDWLLPIIGLSFLFSLYRWGRRRANFSDLALLFLALFIALLLFQMGALVSDTWSKSRYVFIIALPAFLLLSAGSLGQVLTGLVALVSKISQNRPLVTGVRALAVIGGVALIVTHWGTPAWNMAQAQSTGDYNTAFAYVREHWQPDDKVMTTHPAAAYLYLRRCDYYANRVSAAVFREEAEENSLHDRYTGSPLVDSAGAAQRSVGFGPAVVVCGRCFAAVPAFVLLVTSKSWPRWITTVPARPMSFSAGPTPSPSLRTTSLAGSQFLQYHPVGRLQF
ncbi:MAG: glycosyltransferase family 39 protein [Anaerolineae bacterium]